MVLESLTNVQNAQKHPVYLFFMAFAMTSAGIFLSHQIFPESSSVLTIALVTIGFMPVLHSLFQIEEEKEVDEDDMPFAFIGTHFDVIHIYGWIFVGMIITYSFWSVVLPTDNSDCTGLGCALPLRQEVFAAQEKTYTSITGAPPVTGNAVGSEECFNSMSKTFEGCFQLIFNNNMLVLILAIVFSFIWGAGALILLGWNASIIGLFIGLEITSRSLDAGLSRAISYLPHGIPEILAYFIASIAGGIISAAISKKTFKKHELRIVAIDSILLLMLGALTLFIAAFIETAAIFAYWEAAIGGIVAFVALYMILYIPSIRYRINRLRENAA